METNKNSPPSPFDHPGHVVPDREYIVYLERAVAGIKTVRMIVYAGLAGFLLLAAYGFFLIYLLTGDAHRITAQTGRMTEEMESMARTMSAMSVTMGDMRSNIGDMRSSMAEMNHNLVDIRASTSHMANTITLIQHSTRNLDASFGPGMGMMNSIMPFGAGGNNYGGAPPYAPPPSR
jgi:hypothetical protein